MAEEEKQGSSVEESGKSVAARARRFLKKTAGLLAVVVAYRKRQQSKDCGEKAKSAQEVRDQLQSRCPWWGP